MTALAAPCRHRLASSLNFQRMLCGVVLVDPDGERWTTDPARVTCRGCLRATRQPAASPKGRQSVTGAGAAQAGAGNRVVREVEQ